MADMPDFTVAHPTEPKRFRVDGDVFECAAVLPAGASRDLVSIAGADLHTQVTLLGSFLDSVMLPDSAERFARRMRDPLHPITDDQVGDVIVWLIKEYGKRPTTPSPSSASGSGDGGTTSMAGAPPGASTR